MKKLNKLFIVGLLTSVPLLAMEYSDDLWMKEDEDALLNAPLTPSIPVTPRTPFTPNTPASLFGTFDLPTEIEKLAPSSTEEENIQNDSTGISNEEAQDEDQVQPNKKVKLGHFYPYEKVDNHLYCLFCHFDADSDSIKAMKAHINRDHAEQTREWRNKKNETVCAECNKDFGNPSRLKEHLPVHTKAKDHVCNECGKAFAQSSSLSDHKTTIHQKKRHSCSECGKTFARKSAVAVHMAGVHFKSKQFKCEPCNKEFPAKRYFKEHIKGKKHIVRMQILQNTGELPPLPKKRKRKTADVAEKVEKFACKSRECKPKGITFDSPLELQQHKVKVHIEPVVGYSPNYCTVEGCYTVCSSKSELEKHMRKHTGEKPFPCEICNKVFSTREGLTHHLKTKIHLEQMNIYYGGRNETNQ